MTQRLLLPSALTVLTAAFALGVSAPAASSSPAADIAAAEAAAFTEADANGDGALTQDELSAGHPGACGGFPAPPPF